jgi:uncharacterized protein (DUF4415 family)
MKPSESSPHEKQRNASRPRSSGASGGAYERTDAAEDKDIDFSDIPEVDAEAFARGIMRKGLKPLPGKRQVTLRIDEDVLDWFKAGGKGYQTRINALLRAYMEAHDEQ